MMRWIVDTSLRFRRVVLALAAGCLVVGIVQVGRVQKDALPEFGPTTVEVQTEALGLSAAEVEQLITVPLEQDLLVGVPFLDQMESVSLPGLSSVMMTFESGTDLLAARQVVQERLTQAVGIAGLPAVAKTPQMMQPHSSSSRAAMVKMTSDALTPIELSVLARWVIGPRLLGVDGVANVSIWGNRERQLQVLVDPERLRDNGVTVAQVIRTAGNALEVSPLSYLEASKPGTGGFIDTTNQRLNIFHEQAITTSQELAQVPLEGRSTGGDGPALLGDVANVVEDHQPLIGDTACQGGTPCLLMVVEKFPGASNQAVAEGVDATLTALAPGMTDVAFDSSVYRPAQYVESATTHLGWVLLIGACLLLLLVGAVLWEWRRTAIVAVGLGVSAGSAFLVLGLTEITVNVMVLTGLLLGVTVLVDDAVSDVTTIARKLQHDRAAGKSMPLWATVLEAVAASRRTLVFATLVVAVAAIPLFFLPGPAGAFLPTVALSYLLATAVSLVVALTVTPAVAVVLLSGDPEAARRSPVSSWMHAGHARVERRTLAHPIATIAVFAALGVAAVAVSPFLSASMQPGLHERDVVVTVEAPPGTSLPRMTEIAQGAVSAVDALPGVVAVNAQIGRAVMSDRTVDVSQAQLWVNLADGGDYDGLVAAVTDALAVLPDGVSSEVTTYSESRVRDLLEGDTDDVVVRVYGEDPDTLVAMAAELRDGIGGIEGVTDARVQQTPEEDTIEVTVDLARAQQAGIKPGDVRRAAAILIGGITVGNLFEDQKVFDVVVWGDPGIRDSQTDIENLLVDTPDGGSVRLGDVADVRTVSSAAVIRHDSVARFVEVRAGVSGRDVGEVANEVRALVAGTSFPRDHHAEVLGGNTESQDDLSRLLTVSLAALLVGLLLLQAAFRSWRPATMALLAMPVALSGGVLAATVTGGSLSLGEAAGLLATLGVGARSIVAMVRHLLHLQRREGMELDEALVRRGTADRLVPTLLTAGAVAAVLLPVAVLGGLTGFEVLRPAAYVVLGGLVTSVAVSLVAVPLAFVRLAPTEDVDGWADELLVEVPVPDPIRR